MNSTDLQFQELRKFQVQEIARALRIPEHLLGAVGTRDVEQRRDGW